MKKIIIAVVIVVVLVGAGLGTYFTMEASATQKQVINENQMPKKDTNQNQTPKKVENPVKSNENPGVDYNNISYKQVNFNGISIQCPTFLSKENNGNNTMTLSSADNSVVLNLNQIPNENGIENYYNQAVSNTNNVVYKYVNSKTFSLSWENGSNGIYESGIVNGNSIVIFKITFPEKDKDKISDTITKIYKSFIANMSNSQSTTVTPSNNDNQPLTYNEAKNYVHRYLVDTNQWKKSHGQYVYQIGQDLQISLSAKPEAMAPEIIGTNYSNSLETQKCINEINASGIRYAFEYDMIFSGNSITGGNIQRLGDYYVTQNSVYLDDVCNMIVTKVADIDNGNLTNVIKPPAGV